MRLCKIQAGAKQWVAGLEVERCYLAFPTIFQHYGWAVNDGVLDVRTFPFVPVALGLLSVFACTPAPWGVRARRKIVQAHSCFHFCVSLFVHARVYFAFARACSAHINMNGDACVAMHDAAVPFGSFRTL
jgi:hypothetical protein